MNIAFDATAILGPMSKNRGIGNYGLAQFRSILALDRDNQYFFFNLFEPFSFGLHTNLVEEYYYSGKEFGLLQVGDCAVFGELVKNYIRNNKIDVFYITSPFEDHIPVYRKEWFVGCKTIATVYDIIPFIFKDHYFKQEIASWYLERIELISWIDKLLVISQSVKDDLIHYLGFDSKKIDVIWGAPGEFFHEIDVEEEAKVAIQKRYHIKGQFILCTGGDDERKNIAGLIEAYGNLPSNLIEKYSLVIVCKLQDSSEKRYRKIARKCGVERKVILTNFVTNEELVQLYNMSTLLAFPSKYEGFGLPVTEAWACGKPVLTADNSSLCQIAGDAATLVDADDIDDISKGLEVALQEDSLEEMARRGKERLKYFQWSEVAANSINGIMQLAEDKKGKTQKDNPRLAFFSPLPPQQSGIADYSVDILSGIADRFNIDVYIDDGYEVDCILPDGIQIMNHRMFHKNVNNYKYILYQMGNSLFHYYMLPYLHKYGGIVVLHDYNMHGVAQAIGLVEKKDNFKTYLEFLSEDLSEKQVTQIMNQLRGGHWPDRSIEINGFVVNYADRIIVHSNHAKEKLLRKNIGRRVGWIPHYAVIDPMPDVDRAKEKNGISNHAIVFAAFGHIHENKRAVPLLKAACRILEERPEAMFLFVGKVDDGISSEFETVLQQSSVSDRIIITGYTSIKEFCGYMDSADVCFNLRYPYNGENSGSLARLLARGKCVVINDVGSFSEVPDECCIKLPSVETMTNTEEVDIIYRTMIELLEDETKRNSIGRNARQYAEKTLDLRIVANQYADFITANYSKGISERLLEDIRQDEIMKKHYTESEIRNIAKTIGYCVV